MENTKKIIIPSSFSGMRLDICLSNLQLQYSRSQLKQWINSGNILVNGKVTKPKLKINGGETVIIREVFQNKVNWDAEKIPLNIIYEDNHVLIINKQAGIVVHPGAGNLSGTIANGLLAYNETFKHIPRYGIVHRLDKDTSGIMIIAKTLVAHNSLVNQLANRTMTREYRAIVLGYLPQSKKIVSKIGRSHINRKKMAVTLQGKEAVTLVSVLQYYSNKYTSISCQLETGRTHQIRVHMHHINHPLIGDKTYKYKDSANIPSKYVENFHRQALHAIKLSFVHPYLHKCLTFKAAMPEDMIKLTEKLEKI